MMRILTAAALACTLVLGGCSTFDPIDMFQDWDLLGSGKKPLPGERRAVFPEGVPGVPQGVPPEMTKGYQPPPEAPPPVIEAKPPPRQKKTASAPPQQRRAAPKRQQPQEVEQDEQPVQQAPAAARTQPVQSQGGWQQMPGSQPTWPTNAQPAPQR
jgi:hypothetical protein